MASTEKQKLIVTSALPYANGSIHIGHLVEYIQTDILVRFYKLIGTDAIYCCADDTHGTPIEIKASQLGITPEELIANSAKEHLEDFKAFNIAFDSYHSTNSEENKNIVLQFYEQLKKNKDLEEREMELTYCEHDKRFLPDRFVKGTCPKCGAEDQYGDQCEKCNSTYETIDLVDPYCTLCKNTPVRKNSTHLFFKLTNYTEKLKTWLESNKNLQSDVKNQIMNWITSDEGLQNWCISRDPPYFGFAIPDQKDKYFYVWLDAPVGYISSLANYYKGDTQQALDVWKNSKILHVIGKDIIYFHWLFWPAILMAQGMNPPDNILVHGFLTVNKEKMSKSRGTFLSAKQFLEMCNNPELLRYYYASNLTNNMVDIDLDLKDFQERINSELVSNLANFVYRSLSFLNKNFDGKTVAITDDSCKKLFTNTSLLAKQAKDKYSGHNLREVVKRILGIGAEGNKFFQENEPWALVKGSDEDKARAHQVLSACAALVKDIAILMHPIMPVFAQQVLEQVNCPLDSTTLGKELGEHTIGDAKIILTKIEPITLPKGEQKDDTGNSNCFPLNLKVGKIESVDDHPDAEKLYLIKVNLGEETRQLVAGLKPFLAKEELLGKHIIVVTNLEPAKLRGQKSEGMLLAADKGDVVVPLQAPKSSPGDAVTLGEVASNTNQINYKQFTKVKFSVKDKTVFVDGKQLKTASESVLADIDDGATVR